MEISDLHDKEFKVMVIRMLTECGTGMDENFKKENEIAKKSKS